MSLAVQELGVALFAVLLFAGATAVAVRDEYKVGAWVAVVAFFASSLLAAWLLWRLL